MLALELEQSLKDFIYTQNKNYKDIKNFSMLTKEEALNLPKILLEKKYTFCDNKTLPPCGTFKRVIRIDFSAAAELHNPLYEKIYTYSVNSIMTFWKNRITLTKFGRKYSHNFFSNLSILEKTIPLQNYIRCVNKPIIVFGSGESIDSGIMQIKQNKDDFFILATDTALKPLLQNNITPHGVFIEEAQNIILKAFTGTKSDSFTIFAGLSSISSLSHNFDHSRISFFTTEYTSSFFIDSLKEKNILPPLNMPFGSVGLTTFYYALSFRKDDSVPIFTYGLDFCYTKGRTHAKGTMAHQNMILQNNRLNSIYNFNSAFSPSAIFDPHTNTYTTPLLQSYASLFVNLFSHSQYKNVYNSSPLSNNIALPFSKPFVPQTCNSIELKNYKIDGKKISQYLENEKNELLELKALLTTKTDYSEEELKEKITKLATTKEYLFLHFPDGHQFLYTQDFLNRIRIEIDFFLKLF